jgi:hypothetical protein
VLRIERRVRSDSSSPRLLILFAFGATGGVLLDAMHTFSNTTEYTPPFVLRTAWWVPLLFTCAYGFGGLLYDDGWKRLRGPSALAPARDVAIAMVVFAALYAASGYAPIGNGSKTLLLLVGAIALWLYTDRTWQGIILTCVAGFFGPLAEVLLSRAGVFRHQQPNFLGIPFWLPALYLSTGPSFGQLARRVLNPETPRPS